MYKNIDNQDNIEPIERTNMQGIPDLAENQELKLDNSSNSTTGENIKTNIKVTTRNKNTPNGKNYRLLCDICRGYYSSCKEFNKYMSEAYSMMYQCNARTCNKTFTSENS